MKLEACPYISGAFELLSRKWFGVILHTISLAPELELHFTDLKTGIPHITSRVLSMRLNELTQEGLIDKIESEKHHVYRLTQKGIDLTSALKDIEGWAHKYIVAE